MHKARVWQFARNSRARDFFFLARIFIGLVERYPRAIITTTLDTAGYPHVGRKREIYYWRIRAERPSETSALLPSLSWRESKKRYSYILLELNLRISRDFIC